MFVPQTFRSTSGVLNAAPNPQLTLKGTTSVGVEMEYESILIVTFVTDEDGVLKMKRVESFVDSKAYLELFKAAAEGKATMQQYAA